jgi:hypothetical protein
MATPFPALVAAGASLVTIVLAIPLNTFLLLDFTRTILGACAFHRRFSFPTGLLFTVSSSLGRYEGFEGQSTEMKQPHSFPRGCSAYQQRYYYLCILGLFAETSTNTYG